MLTSMHYYGHYTTFAKNQNKTNKANKQKNDVDSERSFVKNPGKSEVKPTEDKNSFVLNKSLKKEIVEYAKDTSESVNNIKTSARHVINDMNNFNKNVKKDGVAVAKDWILESAEEFIRDFNKTIKTLKKQEHGPDLKQFSKNIEETLYNNLDSLHMIGVQKEEDGKLKLNRKKLQAFKADEINMAIGENMDIFNSILEESTTLLKKPLSEHMNFKSFNYFYNYKVGSMQTNSFAMIQTGMLVDIAV